ncbi:hypothetical protein Dsin_020757 [Dipteronia sinensis]|uniref:RRM domain-containing protein n=1 Tax=Dipteronia sinensis TaxID=43782 RepID=A0AAE0E497_9ROSI|nr:hypothetical protein Dsin_020757 [Dipteronia sinensis]
MAFCSRLGMLVKQSGQVPMASMLSSACHMSSKLFVGGLSYTTDDHSLKEAFPSFGEVVEARIVSDRDTGRSRGFGFVNFSSEDSAQTAMSAMDGQELNGRSIRVNFANMVAVMVAATVTVVTGEAIEMTMKEVAIKQINVIFMSLIL